MNTESKTDRTWQEDLREMTPSPLTLGALSVLAIVFVWFYWQSLWTLRGTWMQDDYQHGPFVPIFSLFLLWYRRDMIMPFAGRGSWWGLALLAFWAVMLWAAVYFNFQSLPEMSMIPFFAGFALFVGGWQALRWAWPAIVFLVFMLPLPGEIQGLVSLQLQSVSARLSVYIIQTLGFPATNMGHVIRLTNRDLDVEQACSGLRMMTMFFAMCVGASFIVRKPVWEKLFIIASAGPIAVLGNVARIVVTAVFCEFARWWPSLLDSEHVMEFVHDWAGYAIEMPAGLLLLWLELTLLSKLLTPPMEERPLMMGHVLEERVPANGQGVQRKR